MTTRIWIKLYIGMLEDPQMGQLPDKLWRRLVELHLLAGKNGDDGRLPPLPDLAWALRISEEELSASLQALAEAGMLEVDPLRPTATSPKCKDGILGRGEQPEQWTVSHFAESQAAMPVNERMHRYRERKKQVTERNESGYEGAGVDSTSTSPSSSISSSESLKESAENFENSPEKASPPEGNIPASPAEAMLHPDMQVFKAATGGRMPGLAQYRPVIETIRILRQKKRLDDRALAAYLAPFWRTWSGRKRQDGRPYDPGNISWLTEWALNSAIPPQAKRSRAEAKKGRAVEEQVARFLGKRGG